MNSFIESRQMDFAQYLRAVCIDTQTSDDDPPFKELTIVPQACKFDIREVDYAHWRYWHQKFFTEQEDVLETLSALPHGMPSSPVVVVVVITSINSLILTLWFTCHY